MLCVEVDAKDSVVILGRDGRVVYVEVELAFVLVRVRGGEGDLGFEGIDVKFVVDCPIVDGVEVGL